MSLRFDGKVAVVTGHVPLANVSKAITVELILKKLRIMNMSLKTEFNVDKPKIANLGLNPHAGDNDLLGKEEKERINKAVEDAQQTVVRLRSRREALERKAGEIGGLRDGQGSVQNG